MVISYRDSQLKRKYVDYMPVHWIADNTLWFPPDGKSEAVSQVVNKSTWRKYYIRRSYWDTRTFSRKEATEKANEIRKTEEREAEEKGDSTSTDADVPAHRPVVKQVNARTHPPPAPKVLARSRLFPKPPPSVHMLQKKRKQIRSPTPATSEEEERDPTWGSEKKRKKPHKAAQSVATCTTTPEQLVTTAQTSDPQQQSEKTATPSIGLSQQTATPTGVKQRLQTSVTVRADPPQPPVTMTVQTPDPPQSVSAVTPRIPQSQQVMAYFILVSGIIVPHWHSIAKRGGHFQRHLIFCGLSI